MNEWNDLRFVCPEDNQIVIVCDCFNSFITLARFREIDDEGHFDLMFIDDVEIDSQVTHWMELPKLPGIYE